MDEVMISELELKIREAMQKKFYVQVININS